MITLGGITLVGSQHHQQAASNERAVKEWILKHITKCSRNGIKKPAKLLRAAVIGH